MRLTADDHAAIADQVVEKLRAQTVCPHGIDADTARDIRDAAEDYRAFEKAAKGWLVKLVIVALAGGLVMAAIIIAQFNWLAELLPK